MTAVAETRYALRTRVRVDQLRSALRRAIRVTSRGCIPPLRCVRLTTLGQGLFLEATDMEVRLRERIPAVVEYAGEAVVPARLLARVVNLIPAGTEWVSLRGECGSADPAVEVAWDRSMYRLMAFAPGAFPPSVRPDPVCLATVVTDDLRTMLGRALWAAGEDESRPWLEGVRLTVEEGTVRAVATNGCCVGRTEISTVTASGGTTTVIIPTRGVREIITALKRTEEASAHIVRNGSCLTVEIGETEVVSRTIDATYPDVERLIPGEYAHSVEFDRPALLSAIRRLVEISRDGTTRWWLGPLQESCL